MALMPWRTGGVDRLSGWPLAVDISNDLDGRTPGRMSAPEDDKGVDFTLLDGTLGGLHVGEGLEGENLLGLDHRAPAKCRGDL
jgi:hypothetical protein